MKHASELFPQALNRLIEMGEKARKEREQKERNACDRETIRATAKEIVTGKRARENGDYLKMRSAHKEKYENGIQLYKGSTSNR